MVLSSFSTLAGLSSLVARYDLFWVDVWGTLFSGRQAYPGVIACLQQLRNAHKKIIFVTNVPMLKDDLSPSLAHLGIGPNLYDDIVTAGDIVQKSLQEKKERFSSRGKTFFYLGPKPPPAHHLNLIKETGFSHVESLEKASLLLNCAITDTSEEMETKYADILDRARELELPMMCCNPDRVGLGPRGSKCCAGYGADMYADRGGEVFFCGKPVPHIYDIAFSMDSAEKNRVLAVGDGMITDVKGALAYGIDVAFIPGGIHAGDLYGYGEKVHDRPKLEDFFQERDAFPTHVISGFIW